MKKFWELKNSANDPESLDLYIYSAVDDYSKWNDETQKYEKSKTSGEYFRKQLDEHPDVKNINVYINSVGGSVYEGLGIYNQLVRHPAKVTAYIDGFACSIASVIAMAADEVIMPENSVMMIHNASCIAWGNAEEMRKTADSLDVISKSIRQSYVTKSNGKATDEKFKELMDAETYLTAAECMELGLADKYSDKNIAIENAKKELESLTNEADSSYRQRMEKICAIANTIPAKHEPEPTPTPKNEVDVDNLINKLFY